MTSRYNQGKIYKMVNTVDDRIYIGSTCLPLAKRFYDHKKAARHTITQLVYAALNIIGWENVRIVLIESYVCSNKQELIAREQHYMDLLKPALNKNAANGQLCEHQRVRGKCKDCGGSQICQHQRQRAQCVDCGGSGICQHQRRRTHCIDCGGSCICQHQRERNKCKDCRGSGICQHKRQRNRCKDCSPAECDFCGITTSKGDYDRHCESAKHIANEAAEFLRLFGIPFN